MSDIKMIYGVFSWKDDPLIQDLERLALPCRIHITSYQSLDETKKLLKIISDTDYIIDRIGLYEAEYGDDEAEALCKRELFFFRLEKLLEGKKKTHPLLSSAVPWKPMHRFQQWEKVRILSEIEAPRATLRFRGRVEHESICARTVLCDATDDYFWQVVNENIDQTLSSLSDEVMLFERPLGEPIFSFLCGNTIYIEPPSQNDIKIRKASREIAKILGIDLGEILFFNDQDKLAFGYASNYPINISESTRLNGLYTWLTT